jgi:hypothetical protein
VNKSLSLDNAYEVPSHLLAKLNFSAVLVSLRIFYVCFSTLRLALFIINDIRLPVWYRFGS